VTNQQSNTITVVDITPTGSVIPIGVVPVGGSGPVSVAIDPAGFAYVANQNSDNVSVFAITPYGQPMPIGTVPAGSMPQSVTIVQ